MVPDSVRLWAHLMVTKSAHHSDQKSELRSVQALVSRTERWSENSSDEALRPVPAVRELEHQLVDLSALVKELVSVFQ